MRRSLLVRGLLLDVCHRVVKRIWRKRESATPDIHSGLLRHTDSPLWTEPVEARLMLTVTASADIAGNAVTFAGDGADDELHLHLDESGLLSYSATGGLLTADLDPAQGVQSLVPNSSTKIVVSLGSGGDKFVLDALLTGALGEGNLTFGDAPEDFEWDGTILADRVSLSRPAPGQISISADNDLHTIKSLTIPDPGNSLKIDLGFNAASTDEHIHVGDLGTYDGNLILSGGPLSKMEDGEDTVEFKNDLNLNGHDLTVTAEHINVNSGVTITTVVAGAATAGKIELNGWQINVNDNAKLLANGTTPGDISILAEDKSSIWTPLLNIDISNVAVTIGTGAQVKGGAVTVRATADTRHILTSDDWAVKAIDKVASIIQGLTQIGAGVAWVQSDAHININAGSEIDSTTFIAHSSAYAWASTAPTTFMVGPALGVDVTNSTVTVAGTIRSTGDMTIRSTTDHSLDVLSDTSGLKGIAASIAVSVIDSTTKADVTDEADLSAGGNLFVQADTVDCNRTMSRSTAGKDGSVGIALTVSVQGGDTSAFLDGKATANGNIEVNAIQKQDSIDVNKLWVIPSTASGVSASAGVGSNSTGDLLDDVKKQAMTSAKGVIMPWLKAKWNEWRGKTSQAGENAPSAEPNFDIAGAAAVSVVTNNTTARIGDGDTSDHGGKKAIVQADGKLTVKSSASSPPQIQAGSSAENNDGAPASEGTDKFAGSLAVAVGVYTNNAQAYINSDAEVDAQSDLTVKAETLNDYTWTWQANAVTPFLQSPTHTTDDGTKDVSNGDIVEVRGDHANYGDAGNWYKYIGSTPTRTMNLWTEDFRNTNEWEDLGNAIVYRSMNFVKNLTGYLTSDMGIGGIGNSWTQATAKGTKKSIAAAGAVTFLELGNDAEATIKSGAKINQTRADYYAAGQQNVAVRATDHNQAVLMGGNISLPGIQGTPSADIKQFKLDPQKPGFGTETKDGEGAVGFTLLMYDWHNTAKAKIEDGVTLHADNLAVTADQSVMSIVIGASGGESNNFAFNGVFIVNLVDNTTLAQIGNGATIDVGSGSVADADGQSSAVFVSATDTTFVIDVAGGVAVSDQIGVGATVAVNVVNRDTQAVIGNLADDNSADARQTFGAGGDVRVRAKNEGFIGAFTVAGSKTSQNSETAPQGSTGMTDTDGNSVDDPGKLPNNQKNYDSVIAELKAKFGESTTDTNGGGNGASGKVGISISGAVSLDIVTQDARAYVRNTGIMTIAGQLALTSNDSTSLGSLSGAVALALGGGSGESTQVGIAGAVGLNFVGGTTDAFVDGPTSISTTGLSADATRGGFLVSVTAGLAGAKGRQGYAIAGSVGVSRIANTTETALRNTTGTVSGPISLSANDSNAIILVAGSGGFGGKAGVGAAVAYTQIANIVRSTIDGVTSLKHTGNLDVEAASNSLIVAVTGSVGVGGTSGDSGGGGAGTLSINLINNIVEAKIINSTDTADSTGVLTIHGDDHSFIFSFAGAFGGGKTAGLGVALALNFMNNQVWAAVENSTLRSTDGSATVKAEETGGCVTLAVGGGGAERFAVAGAVAVNQFGNVIDAHVSGNSTLRTAGAIWISASDTSTSVAIAGGGAGAKNAAAGAGIGANLLFNTVTAQVNGSTVESTGATVDVLATAQQVLVSVVIGGAGAQSFALGGAVSVNEVKNTVEASVIGGSNIDAVGRINVIANDNSTIVVVAGAGAGAQSAAIGASAATAQIQNTIKAHIDGSTVTSSSGAINVLAGFAPPSSPADITQIGLGTSGIALDPSSGKQIVNVTLAGSGAQTFAAGGAISLNWLRNGVEAYITGSSDVDGVGDVTVAAADKPEIDSGAGAGAGAGTAAIGASISYNYIGGDPGNPSRNVPTDPSSADVGMSRAYISGSTVDSSAGMVSVLASSDPRIINATVGGAGAGQVSISGSISINFIRTIVDAKIVNGATVTGHTGVDIDAWTTPLMIIIAGNGGGAGAIAAAAASATNDMRSSVQARIEGATVTATTGPIWVHAEVRRPNLLPSISALEALDAQIWSFAVSGSGAGTGSISGSIALNWIRNTVDAHISGGAIVHADAGELSLSAADHATINCIAGTGNGSGTFAIGASVATNQIGGDPDHPLDPPNNIITAYIDASTVTAQSLEIATNSDADINILCFAGSGSGTVSANGSVALNWVRKTLDSHISGASLVTIANDASVTSNDTSRIWCLSAQGGGAGYVAGGIALAYNQISNTIEAYVDGSTFTSTNGSIAINATSAATIGTIAAGLAVSGVAAVAGSGAINLINNSVLAWINAATVTANNNITLIAESTNSMTAWGGTVSGSLAVGIGGTAIANYASNTTKAYISGNSDVTARGVGAGTPVKTWADDAAGTESYELVRGLAVIANTTEDLDVVAVTAGVTLPRLTGAVGIGASIAVDIVTDTTEAYIDNSNINSAASQGQWVKVKAHQNTNVNNSGGTLGVGDVGVGADVHVDVLTSQTRAYITDTKPNTGNPTRTAVYGGAGIEVNALSREFAQTVAVGAGIGSYVGAAGAGGAVYFGSTTEAYVAESSLTSGGAISVLANDRATLRFYVGGLGGSLIVGAGGSVAVGVINNTARAYMAGAVTSSVGDTLVKANVAEDVMSIVANGGIGGIAGVSGAVCVVVTGSTAQAYIGSSPLRDSNITSTGGDVLVQAHDQTRVNDGSGSLAGGLGAGVGASVDVITIKNTVDAHIGAHTTVSANSDAKVEATADRDIDSTVIAFGIGGSAINGAVSVISVGRGMDSDGVSQVSAVQSSVNALINPSGGIDGLSTDSSDSTAQRARTLANANYFTVSLASDTAPTDTMAYIGDSANVAATNGDVVVRADEKFELSDAGGDGALGQLVGGVALSICGSAGGSVAVTNIGSAVQAYIGAGATVSAGGDVRVTSAFTDNLQSRAYGGSAAISVGLGAQVAIVNDSTSQLAYTGDATSVVDATKILKARTFEVKAQGTRTHLVEAKGASVGAVAAGAAIGRSIAGGQTKAYLGNYTQVGQDVTQVNNINVSATSTDNLKSDVLAVAAGIGGGSGNESTARSTPTVEAYVGQHAAVTTLYDANIDATATPKVDAQTLGINAGAVAVGVSHSIAEASPTIRSYADSNAAITTGRAITGNMVFSSVGQMRDAGDVTFGNNGDITGAPGVTFTANGILKGKPSLTFVVNGVMGSANTLTFRRSAAMSGNPNVHFRYIGDAIAGTVHFRNNGAGTDDTIVRAVGSWINDGYVVGDTITISGTTNNNITATIKGVTATTITLVQDQVLAVENVSATVVVAAANPYRIVRETGSWDTDGFVAGQEISVSGSTSNNTAAAKFSVLGTADGGKVLYIQQALADEDASGSGIVIAAGTTITRDTGSWITDGFAAGLELTIASSDYGTLAGTFHIADVSADGKTMTLTETGVLANQADLPAVSFTITCNNLDSITRGSGSWLADGFFAGQSITITGADARNNKTITVQSISSDGLTLVVTELHSLWSETIAADNTVGIVASTGADTITRDGGDWLAEGFDVGQQITVSGTAQSDGTYTIAAVSADGLTLTLEGTHVLSSDEAIARGTAITIRSDKPDTITRSNGSWIDDGFLAGGTITVGGYSQNNNTYNIASVSADGKTLYLQQRNILINETVPGTDLYVTTTRTDTIRRAAGNWTMDGFQAGQQISVGGSALNNDTYTIGGISSDGTTLILQSSGVIRPETVSSTITMLRDLNIRATQALPGGGLSANSYASGSGGGLVGVNATTAEAFNNLGVVESSVRANATLNVSGTVRILATGNSKQVATATGITIGVVAVGANTASASSSNRVEAYLGDGVAANGAGMVIHATGSDNNYADSTAGTGGVVAGAAASANTTSTSTTKASIGTGTAGRPITVASLDLSAIHTATFNSRSNSVGAGIVGMSGAWNTNTDTATVTAAIGANADIQTQDLVVNALNNTSKDWLPGGVANSDAASGGVIVFGLGKPAAQSLTDISNYTKINIGSGASINVTGDRYNPGRFTLTALNNVLAHDRAKLDAGGAIASAEADSQVRNNVNDATITVGAGATLHSVGNMDLIAYTIADIAAQSNVKTYGGAGAAAGYTKAYENASNHVNIVGPATTLTSDADINLMAGHGPNCDTSIFRISARTDLWNKTALPIKTDPGADGILNQSNQIDVGAGAALSSIGNAKLLADKGVSEIEGKGVGKDLYRQAAEALANTVGSIFGGGDVSLDIQGGSVTNTGIAQVSVEGSVTVSTQNTQLLYINADGTRDTAGSSPEVTYTVTTESLANNIQAEIDRLTALKAKFASLASVAQAYQLEIDRLSAQLGSLGGANVDVDFINLGNIWAQASSIYITGDLLTGASGAVLNAPGDAKIEVINQSNKFLRTGLLTIPENKGGYIYFNSVSVTTPADISHRNTGSVASGFAASNVLTGVGAPQPLINIQNTYTGAMGGLPTDIYVAADASNFLGTISIAAKGSIYVQDDVLVSAESIHIDAGLDLVQGYTPGVRNLSGEPRIQWQNEANISEAYSINRSVAGVKPGRDPSIAGRNVFMSAEYLNLNGLVQSGKPNWTLTLPASLDAWISNQIALHPGEAFDLPMSDTNYFPALAEGWTQISAHYQPNPGGVGGAIVIAPAIVQGGHIELAGRILNSGTGEIRVLDGYGNINVTNNTAYDIRITSLDAGRGIPGYIKIIDNNRQSGDLGQEFDITRENGVITTTTNFGSAAGIVSTSDGRHATFAPLSGLYYTWLRKQVTQQEVRQTKVKHHYVFGLFSKSDTYWQAPWVFSRSAIEDVKDHVGLIVSYPGHTEDYWYQHTQSIQETPLTYIEGSYVDDTFWGWGDETWQYSKIQTITDYHEHHVKAFYPINISFIGNESSESSVNINSTRAGIQIDGSIYSRSGIISLTAATGITQTSDTAVLVGHEITLTAGTAIGNDAPIRTDLQTENSPGYTSGATASLTATITGTGNINISEIRGPLPVKQADAPAGNVTLSADLDIVPFDGSTVIHGGLITLNSHGGGIGAIGTSVSAANRLLINTGLTRADGLIASASGSIFLHEQSGNLQLISATSLAGIVDLDAPADILDYNTQETPDLRTRNQLLAIWADMALGNTAANPAKETLNAYRAMKQREYRAYWAYRHQQDTPANPTAHETYDPTFQIHLSDIERAYYRDTLGWTDEQIAGLEATRTTEYHDLHTIYGSLDVNNDGQVDTDYDPAYTYELTAAETAALSDGAGWSEDELTWSIAAGILKETTDTELAIEAPNAAGADITLHAAGAIGGVKLDSPAEVVISTAVTQVAFDPATAVAGDTITFAQPHGFAAGQAVLYKPADNAIHIPGLALNTTYYVLALDATTIKLADTEADALAGTGIITLSTPTGSAQDTFRTTLSDTQKLLLMTAERTDMTIDLAAQIITLRLRDDVDVQATGRINVTAGTFIYLGSEEDMAIDTVSGTGEIRIKGAKSVTSDSSTPGAANVVGTNTILEAAEGGIGTGSTPFRIDLANGATLTARAAQDIYVTELTGNINVDTIYSIADLYLTSATGAILDAFDDDASAIPLANKLNIRCASATLNAATFVGQSGKMIELNLDAAGVINATAANGGVYLYETAGDMNVGRITAANGDASLKAAVSILDSNDDPNADVIANNIVLTTVAGGIGAPANELDIDTNLAAQGGLTVSADASIYLVETTGSLVLRSVTVNHHVSATGLAYIYAPGNVLDPSAFSSAAPAFAAGALFAPDPPPTAVLYADSTIIQGQTGIGTPDNPLVISASSIEGVAPDGGMWLVNTGDLTVGGVSEAYSGLDARDEVSIRTLGALTITEDVVSDTSGIIFKSQDSPDDPPKSGDLNVVGAAIQSPNGTTTFAVDNTLFIDSDSTVDAPAGVIIQLDYAGDSYYSSPDTGGVSEARIDGIITTNLLDISGGSDADTFTIGGEVGDTILRGGGGDDEFSFSGMARPGTSVKAYGGDGSDTFTVDNWTGALLLDGESGSDTYDIALSGSGGAAILLRDTGIEIDDALTVRGSSAADNLVLIAGQVSNGPQVLTYYGVETLQINGVGGNDTFTINGNNLPTTINGGNGGDTFNINASVVPMEVNANGSANLINLHGNAGPLTVNGGDDGDRFVIDGNAGLATLNGGAGTAAFQVLGNAGGLFLNGGDGNSSFLVTGNSGNLHISGGNGANTVTLDGNNGLAIVRGGAGSNTLTCLSNYGTAEFYGGTGANLLSFSGHTGNLSLHGGDGDSTFIAGVCSTPPALFGATGKSRFILSGCTSATITGGPGEDTIVFVKDADYTLTDSLLSVSTGERFQLVGVDTADLTAGASANTFDVSGWTGGGTLDGQGGDDRVISQRDADFRLTDASLDVSTGTSLVLRGIKLATLTGGAGVNGFDIANWSGIATLDGQAGDDAYAVTIGGGGRVNIQDSGQSDADTLTVIGTPGADAFSLSNGQVVGGNDVIAYNASRPAPTAAAIAPAAPSGIERLAIDSAGGADLISAVSDSTPATLVPNPLATLRFDAQSLPLDVTSAGITPLNGAPVQPAGIGSVEYANVPSATTLATSLDAVRLYYPVTFTATVGGRSAGLPVATGSVTFSIDGIPHSTVPLVDGVATLTLTSLDVGGHTVTAGYSGSSSFLTSASDPVQQRVINPLPVLTTLEAPSLPIRKKEIAFAVLGNDFAPSSIVYIGNTPVTTTFVNRTRLRATLSPALANRAGLFSIQVVTPDPAGGKSSSKPLTMLSPATQIIDNRSREFTSTGKWAVRKGSGYARSVLVSKSGDGTTKAQWTFANLTPGEYRISATWPAGSSAASNAPFTIWAGARRLVALTVDQRRAPKGFKANGALWQSLGTFTVKTGSVMVQLTAKASSAVLADAIRIDRISVASPLSSKKHHRAPRTAAIAAFSATPIKSPAGAGRSEFQVPSAESGPCLLTTPHSLLSTQHSLLIGRDLTLSPFSQYFHP